MTGIYALGMFSQASGDRWPGIVQNGRVLPLSRLLDGAPATVDALLADWSRWDAAIGAAMQSAPQDGWQDEQALTAHMPNMPGDVFGSGANYRKHVVDIIVDTGPGEFKDMTPEERRIAGGKVMDARAAGGRPFVFVANRGALAGPDTELVLPHDHAEPDWELELAVVIGQPAYRVSLDKALDCVAGYSIMNDITSRDLNARPDMPQLGMDWLASKGAPGFKVYGPYITPARFVPDPQKLHVRLSLNDRVMQDEGTDDMIFPVARIIHFIATYTPLRPGDIIMTGSPSGNGTHYNRYLQPGDVMRGEIDGLVGAQVVRCVADPLAPDAATNARKAEAAA
ncbi:5-carboxymethyl-2-hydroxymuconate Delta-isomerase [Sphingomonas paucimobilis]|nr:5-carboxymethyl-2-hydroxymuconate Delta-isomerase [Sphingomonas paucimobilis]